jgi:hypothetical protein
MLWKGLTDPPLTDASLHSHLDGSKAAFENTIKESTGNAVVDFPNIAYTRWWIMDQRVLCFLLGSMELVIACQIIGCTSTAAVWDAVHRLYDAQSRTNVRHVCRQLQLLRKEGSLPPSTCSR